jgi:hypothetical protein
MSAADGGAAGTGVDGAGAVGGPPHPANIIAIHTIPALRMSDLHKVRIA